MLTTEEKGLLRLFICSHPRVTPNDLQRYSAMSDEDVRAILAKFAASRRTTIQGQITALQAVLSQLPQGE